MSTRVEVRLSGVDDDAERLELATARLRTELMSLDVADAGPPAARRPAPPGSRGVDLAEIGNFVILLAQVPDALRQLVTAVRAWLGTSREYTAELVIDGDRITVTGISRQTQDRMIEAWLRAHGLEQASEG